MSPPPPDGEAPRPDGQWTDALPGAGLATIARNAAALVGGEAVARLIGFVIAVYLARVLGAEGFGRIGAALAVVTYLAIVVDAGLDPSTVREVARDSDRVPDLFARVLSVRLVLAVVMYGILAVLVVSLPQDAFGRHDLALLYGGGLLASALNAPWALRGRDEMGRVAAGVVVQHVVYGALVFALVRGPTPTLVLVPVAHVAGEFARSGLYLFVLKRRYPSLVGRAEREPLPPLLRESAPVAGSKALRLFYYQGDVLLLTWMASSQVAGQFLAAHKVVLAAATVAILFQSNLYPTLSRVVDEDKAEGLILQNRATRYGLLLILPAVVAGAALASRGIQLLYGSGWESAETVLAIGLFTVPALLVTLGLQNYLLACGRPKMVLAVDALGTGTHVAAAVWWIPSLGAAGAAWASLTGAVAAAAAAGIFVSRVSGERPLSRGEISVVAAGALMGATVSFMPDLPLFARLASSGLVYLAVLVPLGAVSRRELSALLSLAGDDR